MCVCVFCNRSAKKVKSGDVFAIMAANMYVGTVSVDDQERRRKGEISNIGL